jgi:S1-C subfamily serine protease
MGLKGALVLDVVQGSAADKAGIRPTRRNHKGEIELGDLIIGIDGKTVDSNADLILALERYPVDQEVRITLKRNEEEHEVTVRLKNNK